MYSRKWTKIQFHEGFRILRQQRNIINLAANPLLQVTPIDYRKGTPLRNQDEVDLDATLVDNLFKRYPELKQVPLVNQKPGQFVQENIALKFLRKQKKFIDEGYSQERAFELSEQLYQKQMQKRVDSQLISTNLAMTNNARSFMNLYQQQAEYESRLKAKRIERDWALQKSESEQQLKKETQQKDTEDVDSFRDDLITRYEKTLYKIVSLEHKEPPTQEVRQRDLCDELVLRTKNLFQIYYKRAAVKDRLSGLTDKEIQQSLLESPKKLKKRMDELLKKLDKLGVYLNDDNKMVIPPGIPRFVKDMISTEEFKAALMYRDISFEQKHRGHLDTVEKRLNDLKEQYRILKIQEEQEGSPQERREKDTQIQNILINSAISIPKESTYKLFETKELRNIRLEIKWWERKLELLELQRLEEKVSEHPSSDKVDQLEERKNKIEQRVFDLVEKLRYLKFQIEQENFKETASALFDEHTELINLPNTFKTAGTVKIEDLEQYFTIPYDQRRLTTSSTLNDEQITKMIRRKPIPSAVYDLRKADALNQLNEFDEINFEQEESRQRIIQLTSVNRMRERVKVDTEAEDEIKMQELDYDVDDQMEKESAEEENAMKLFIEKAKARNALIQQQDQQTQKQKEEALSKNKNLRKKK